MSEERGDPQVGDGVPARLHMMYGELGGGQGSEMVKQGPAGWRSRVDGWVRRGTSRVSLLNCETQAHAALLLEGH